MSDAVHHDDDAPTTTGVVEHLVRDDVERKRFLRMAGKGVGGAAIATSFGAFVAACGSSSNKSSNSGNSGTSGSGGDLAIVNYALTLEYLETEFYKKVIKSGLFNGATLSTIKTFGEEEAKHVSALHKVAMNMGTPAPKPTGKFPIKNAKQVSGLAATVENLGAAAYLGQAGAIQSKEVLAAALSIHSIEARHAATLNLVTGKSPTPQGAFATGMTMAQVLKIVKPFIAS